MCSNHKTSVKKSQNLSIKVLTFRSIILSIINTNICHYYELVKKFSKLDGLLILLNVGKLIPKHRKTHYYGLVPSKILFTVYAHFLKIKNFQYSAKSFFGCQYSNFVNLCLKLGVETVEAIILIILGGRHCKTAMGLY